MIGNAGNLRSLIKEYESGFIPNPLDDYHSYTYSLEWFVVDKTETARFQAAETSMIKQIVNDEWPSLDTKYVTIAKTGYTTEFNITNLSIESVGSGNSNYSRVAGTADKLEFTCTQVGNTSLADSIQNAIALCGFKSISEAVYFIKINLLGDKENGKVQEKLPQTKVFPFKLRNYNNVSTSTDARGTTTVLTGQAAMDEAVMDSHISRVEFNFEYLIDGNLSETLEAFQTSLNQMIKNENQYLAEELKNEYSIVLSDQFKEAFGASPIDKDKTLFTSTEKQKNMNLVGKNNAEPIGTMMPGQSIYQEIEEICLHADDLRKELTDDTPGYTKVLQITPHLELKPDGFNPIKGVQSYKVIYHIDYQKKLIQQNMTDHFVKIKNNKSNTVEIFEDGHVHKKYDYLFTGNNDQVLDFNISLQAELTKVYLEPTDSWKNVDFMQDTEDGKKRTEAHNQAINAATEAFKEANAAYVAEEQNWTKYKNALKTNSGTYKDKILEAIGGLSDEKKTKFEVEEDFESKFGDMSFEELITHFKISEPGTQNSGAFGGGRGPNKTYEMIGDFNALAARNNLAKLNKQIKESRTKIKKLGETRDEASEFLSSEEGRINTEIQDTAATLVLGDKIDGYKDATEKLFKRLREEEGTKGIILAEELGDDYITTMSNDDFRTILTAQAQNPIKFQRKIFKDKDDKAKLVSQGAKDKDVFENAQEKYYEAKSGLLSMFYADMTIKGDPFWIEGYMPAKTKKDLFGNSGTNTIIPPVSTQLNGFPYVVIESGKARGTDNYDNVIVESMILSLYAVKSIVSDFSNGIFTQTLSMVKEPSAEFFPNVPIEEEVEEVGDKDGWADDGSKIRNGGTEIEVYGNLGDGEKTKVPLSADQQLAVDMAFHNHMEANKSWDYEAHRYESPELPPEETFVDKVKRSWNSLGNSVDKFLVDKDTLASVVNTQIDDADLNDTLAANAHNPNGILGRHDNPLADNSARMLAANNFLVNQERLGDLCKATPGSDACVQQRASINNLLATVPGLSSEDYGTATARFKVEEYLNDVLADPLTNPDFILTRPEVAAYQVAVAQGSLDITGHDREDVETWVEKYTGERTPNIILDEIKAGTYGSVNNQIQGAIVSNNILTTPTSLVNEEVKEVLSSVPEYTWTKKKYLEQINNPNSNNDWKNTHWFKAKVDEVVTSERVFNPDTRRLELKKINEKTLTIGEANDVNMLAGEINTILENTDIDEAAAAQWYQRSSDALDKELIEKNLTMDEESRTAMNDAMLKKISTTTRIDSMLEKDWEDVKGYVNGINSIENYTNSGIRGDLTGAIRNIELGSELDTLVTEADELNKNLDGYYFDNSQRKDDLKTLEDVEHEIAQKFLNQSDTTTTAVRTLEVEGVKEFVTVVEANETIEVAKQPLLIKQALPLDTTEIIMPGSLRDKINNAGVTTDWAMMNSDKLSQYNEARKMYELITSKNHGELINVTDVENGDFTIKNWNNIGDLTYIDAAGESITIPNTSKYFEIYSDTLNQDYRNPDFDKLKVKIADLFPAVEVGDMTDPSFVTIFPDGYKAEGKRTVFYLDSNK
jgi:hypothetical protein